MLTGVKVCVFTLHGGTIRRQPAWGGVRVGWGCELSCVCELSGSSVGFMKCSRPSVEDPDGQMKGSSSLYGTTLSFNNLML